MDEFESSILQGVTEDEEAKLFANVIDFKAGRCFIKTKFHDVFINVIDHLYRKCRKQWNCVSGIQGLGKTSSVLYYVLECRRRKDHRIHYVDLNEIDVRDKHLDKFSSFSLNFQAEDCLIIDHTTIFNTHYTQKIRNILEGKDIKFILIPAGFTATPYSNGEIDCGRELQLDEECFLKIWSGSLKVLNCKDEGLTQTGKEAYDVFSEHFIMTPRLLHNVLEYMYVFGKTVHQALIQYTKEIQEEIASFKGTGNSAVYDKFILHTTILLQHIPVEGEYIFTVTDARQVMIAFNIFHTDLYTVTQEDIENNAKIFELGVQEGDVVVKVHHLQPYLAPEWRARLPYRLDMVLQKGYSDKIFTVMLQNSAKREFIKLLVSAQEKKGIVLLPLIYNTMETSYQPSETPLDVPQTKSDDWLLLRIPSQRFFHPDQQRIEHFAKDVPTSLNSHYKSLFKVALYLKELATSVDKFVVYPEIQDFLGMDYFVYVTIRMDETEVCSPAKKLRPCKNSVLYLVQVATGATLRGERIGQALNVVKSVFSDTTVAVHVVIIIARSDTLAYPLTSCCLKNITILNLYEKTSSCLQDLLQSNSLLYNFFLRLVRSKQD